MVGLLENEEFGNDVEESFHGLIICLGLREAARKSPDSRIPGLGLNTGTPEYEGGLIPTLSRSSIIDRHANGRWTTYSWNLAYCRG